jgi:alanine racemase
VLRSNAKTLKVMVNGSLAHAVGRICMDQLMINVTNINVKIGDEVIIFGKGGISVLEFAKNNKTIPYEILTSISQRVERVYIK